MKFPRDDWMVIGRALQDRAEVLRNSEGFSVGTLRNAEVQNCERIRRIVDAHVDATWERIRNIVDETQV